MPRNPVPDILIHYLQILTFSPHFRNDPSRPIHLADTDPLRIEQTPITLALCPMAVLVTHSHTGPKTPGPAL